MHSGSMYEHEVSEDVMVARRLTLALAGQTSFRTSLLTQRLAQAELGIKGIMDNVTFPLLCTFVCDGWTNQHGQSIWVFIALVPRVGPVILSVLKAEEDRHDAAWFAGECPSCLALAEQDLGLQMTIMVSYLH